MSKTAYEDLLIFKINTVREFSQGIHNTWNYNFVCLQIISLYKSHVIALATVCY